MSYAITTASSVSVDRVFYLGYKRKPNFMKLQWSLAIIYYWMHYYNLRCNIYQICVQL